MLLTLLAFCLRGRESGPSALSHPPLCHHDDGQLMGSLIFMTSLLDRAHFSPGGEIKKVFLTY